MKYQGTGVDKHKHVLQVIKILYLNCVKYYFCITYDIFTQQHSFPYLENHDVDFNTFPVENTMLTIRNHFDVMIDLISLRNLEFSFGLFDIFQGNI